MDAISPVTINVVRSLNSSRVRVLQGHSYSRCSTVQSPAWGHFLSRVPIKLRSELEASRCLEDFFPERSSASNHTDTQGHIGNGIHRRDSSKVSYLHFQSVWTSSGPMSSLPLWMIPG